MKKTVILTVLKKLRLKQFFRNKDTIKTDDIFETAGLFTGASWKTQIPQSGLTQIPKELFKINLAHNRRN